MDNRSKVDEAEKRGQEQERMCPLTAKACFGKPCMWWHIYDGEYEDGACAMGVIADAIRWMCNSGVNTFEQN